MSAQFAGTLSGTSSSSAAAPSQVLLLAEELEKTRKEVAEQQQTIKHYRDELVKVQRHYVYSEYEKIEAQTALASLVIASEKDNDANEQTIAELQEQIESLSSSVLPAQTHAAILLQVERTIPSLLLEVMNHVCHRQSGVCGADTDLTAIAIPPGVAESVRALHPVAALTQLRLWVRKLLEMDKEIIASQGTKRRFGGQDTAASSRLLRSMSSVMVKPGGANGSNSPDTTEERGAAGSSIAAESTSNTMRSRGSRRWHGADDLQRAAEDEEALELVRKRNNELEREVDSMRKFVTEAEDEVRRVKQAAQLAVYSARRDLGSLRLELREKSREVETLKQRTYLVDRSELVASQDEAAALAKKLQETSKNAQSALQAKTNELIFIEREKSDKIRKLEKQVDRMAAVRNAERELREQLSAAQSDAARAKQQLVRANVKTLIEQKHRQEEKVKEQQAVVDQLQLELEHTQTSLAALQHTNKRMVEQYNQLFEEKLAEARERAAKSRRHDRSAAAQAVVGPNSELNTEYYRTRYQEALAELKTSQKKLKHLIFLSHHDHLSFHLQREDLSRQLKETKSMMHASSDNNNDEDDVDREILRYMEQRARPQSATTRGDDTEVSPRGRDLHRSPSPGTDPTMRSLIHGDFSFASFVEQQQQTKRKRPTSAASTVSFPGDAGGYDVVAPDRTTLTYAVQVIGASHEERSAAAAFQNPVQTVALARVSIARHAAPSSGGAELSKRSTVAPTASKGLERRRQVADDGSVTEEGFELHALDQSAETDGVAERRSPIGKAKKGPTVYMNRAHTQSGVESLSRAMTPLQRPSSSLR